MKRSPLSEAKQVPRKARIAIVDSLPSCRIGLSHHIKKLDLWEIAWSSSTAEEAMEKMKPLREMVDAGHRCRSRAVSWSRHGRHLLGCQGGSGCMPRANWNDNNMARKKSPIDLK